MVEYGISRRPNTGSFTDIYFGEFVALGREIWHAPGLLNKLKYTIMPPGWSHTGDHKTVRALKMQLCPPPHTTYATEETMRLSGIGRSALLAI